jgi:hypothetical protein
MECDSVKNNLHKTKPVWHTTIEKGSMPKKQEQVNEQRKRTTTAAV